LIFVDEDYKVVPPLDKIEWMTTDVQPYKDNFDFLGKLQNSMLFIISRLISLLDK